MQAIHPPRYPLVPLLLSAAAAALVLGGALALTRPTPESAWEDSMRLATTPERVAERFVQAYRAHAYARAANLATGPLASNLRQRASTRHAPDDGRRFLLQESHWLPKGRLRLVGALLRADEDEAAAPDLSLFLSRDGTRWLVDEVDGAEVLDAPSLP